MLEKDLSPGVRHIPRGREKDDVPLAIEVEQMPDGSRCGKGFELCVVTTGELLEPVYVVTVPAAEVGARRHVLHPLVVPDIALLQATRPEPIDENPATGGTTSLVDAMDFKTHIYLV